MTPNIIGLLHKVYADKPANSLYNFNGHNVSEDEQKFLQGPLAEYAEKLPGMLVEDFSFGDPKIKEDIATLLKEHPLKKNQLIDFFICSG
jgi:hypothetical protein